MWKDDHFKSPEDTMQKYAKAISGMTSPRHQSDWGFILMFVFFTTMILGIGFFLGFLIGTAP